MLSVARLEDLNRLVGVPDATLVSYIKASLASIESGVLPEASPEQLRIIEVLAFLFAESSKLQCSETDLRDSLVSFPLEESARDLLCRAYLSASERLRARLMESSVRPPHYVDLDWRLDIELASRSLRQQTIPTWLMKLSVENADGQVESQMLQTDAVNLRHLYEELQMAFGEERTGYAKRVSRNVK